MIKLISFRINNQIRPGLLLHSNQIIDIWKNATDFLPNEQGLFTRDFDMQRAEDKLNELIAINKPTYDCNQVSIVAPIFRPKRNLFCVGKNYMDHVKEIAGAKSEPNPSIPKYPQFFTKVPETVIGNGDIIPSHGSYTKWLDYEAELAVVIGKTGCNISADKALDYIFGYTIANDVTAREVQKHHVQFFKGKSLDGTCPLGPYIRHKSNFDASDLSITLHINGELRQDSRTSQMIFSIPQIIEQLSRGLTLYPGDIILTGTPAGVGYAMSPPRMLRPSDKVRIEIEGLGVLENTVGL